MTWTTNTGARAGHEWQVRYTWEPGPGNHHPRFTYSTAASEDLALDEAVKAVDQMARGTDLRLVEVHRRHISSDLWTRVE